MNSWKISGDQKHIRSYLDVSASLNCQELDLKYKGVSF